MKSQDLGIDPKSRYHDGRLTHHESIFVSCMWDHCGQANRVSADVLAIKFYNRLLSGNRVTTEEAELMLGRYKSIECLSRDLDEWKRNVRATHNHLVMAHEHIPILSKAGNGGGYWISASDDEADAFFHAFRKRGMTGIVKATRGKKASMVAIAEQLSFDFEELATSAGVVIPKAESDPSLRPVAVVDAFLKRMLADPDRYAVGLKMIGKKYGGVLLPRRQVEAMREKAAELSRLVSELI